MALALDELLLDPYDPRWVDYYALRPTMPRSLGAAAAEEGGEEGGEGGGEDAGAGAEDQGGDAAGSSGDTGGEEGKTAMTGGEGASKDGEQAVDWRGSLSDDNRAAVEKFNSVDDVVKSYRELSKKLGATVAVPGEDATEGQIAAFRKKLGIPEDAAEYKLAVPESVKEAVNADEADATLVEFASMAHENNVPPAAMQKLVDAYYTRQVEAQTALAEQVEEQTRAHIRDQMKKWGKDADANVAFAQRVAKEADKSVEGFKDFLENSVVDGVPLGSHPMFLEVFSWLGRGMSEDSVHLEVTPEERESIEDQASALRKKRDKALASGDRTAALRFDEQERALYARTAGRQPVVGSGGRSA